MPDHPNVYVDTAWWNPSDLDRAVHARAAGPDPVGQRLAVRAAVTSRSSRCAARCRRGCDEAVRLVAGGQLARILDGAGRPTPARRRAAPRPSTRCSSASSPTCGGDVARVRRTDPTEALALARLACAVGEDGRARRVCAAVLDLLDRFEEHKGVPAAGRPPDPARGAIGGDRAGGRAHAGRAAARHADGPRADAGRGRARHRDLACAPAPGAGEGRTYPSTATRRRRDAHGRRVTSRSGDFSWRHKPTPAAAVSALPQWPPGMGASLGKFVVGRLVSVAGVVVMVTAVTWL